MSLGVDDRSPSAADASEMTEGCREWQGLTLTAGKQEQLVSEGGENVLAFTATQVIPPDAPIVHMGTLRRRGDTCSAFWPSIHSPPRHQRAAEGRISHSLWIQLGPLLSRVKDRKR